jgi:hypothetical protein
MFNPPITGDRELDAFLSQLVLEGTSGGGSADGVSANPATGIISDVSGNIIGYIYRYLAIKYADDNVGSNMSDSPSNKLYYGVCNSDLSSEPTTPASYTWYQVTGGFGTTKFLWYQSVGGRRINLKVSTASPDSGWVIDPGTAIDIDVVTSGTNITVVDSFSSYFAPAVLQVPRSGDPLTPELNGISPRLYAANANVLVPFVDAQTDSASNFVNNTWRIGNSSTSGNADISYTNITFNAPTDGGEYAVWGNPTSMSNSPATITVPIRFKNSAGIVTQASVAVVQFVFSDPGEQGISGPTVDVTGYTSFVQSAGGAFTPPNTTLTAQLSNVVSPTYSWVVSGATPNSGSSSSITVSPLSNATKVDVTLTVNGSNLSAPIVKVFSMPVVYNGATGQTGANGVMSAFPTIYRWTSSATPPTRPTTTSTYTWATGAYTPPSGWYSSAPSETTQGYYLWSITVPLNEVATATTSTLDWTNTSYPIRCIAYNGTNGGTGATGSAGSSTFVVTRAANDSSAPSNAEVNAVIGRNPVAGDIVTVSYNNYNNATVYRFTTSWILFTTYITGSLIVENTITGDKIVANTITADKINTNNLTIKDSAGNIILGAGTSLNYSNIVASSSWLNSNISIGSDGTLYGAGGGAVSAAGLGAVKTDLSNAPSGILNSNISLGTLNAGAFAYLNAITSANVSSYISGAAIGTAQIGVLTAGNIGAGTIDASKIAANTITAGQIAAGTITADKMSVSNLSAISANLGTITAGSISGTSLSVGASPAISSTTMTGTGAVINSSGTFALGNSSTNITYNGSAMYLNGNVVATGNINLNAVSNLVSVTTTGSLIFTSGTVWDIQTLSITSQGFPIKVDASFIPENRNGGYVIAVYRSTGGVETLVHGGEWYDTSTRIDLRAGSGFANYSLMYSFFFVDQPPAGTHTYILRAISDTGGDFTSNHGARYRSLALTETKR